MWIEAEELHTLLQLLAAVVLGGIVGFDRERGNKPAGLRTHMLVALGSAMFVALGFRILDHTDFQNDLIRSDPLRILEAVVGGIAFLGAGTIFFARGENIVKGLTTAASLWVTAAIGMAVALDYYVIAIAASVLVVMILQLFRLFE